MNSSLPFPLFQALQQIPHVREPFPAGGAESAGFPGEVLDEVEGGPHQTGSFVKHHDGPGPQGVAGFLIGFDSPWAGQRDLGA